MCKGPVDKCVRGSAGDADEEEVRTGSCMVAASLLLRLMQRRPGLAARAGAFHAHMECWDAPCLTLCCWLVAAGLRRCSAAAQVDRRIAEALACPCVDDLKAGPCGQLFVTTFTCFHKSNAEPKGCDCLDVSLAFAVSCARQQHAAAAATAAAARWQQAAAAGRWLCGRSSCCDSSSSAKRQRPAPTLS